MTESLIPYSFIPGTKAKAQEVNANFIALAGKIQDNQTSVTNQLSEFKTEVTGQIQDIETAISSDCAASDLVNTPLLTNAVISAPNGTVEYESQTITIKSGLKVLMPNGLNEKGQLKNIEYTTAEEITKTATNLNSKYVLFLYNDGSTNYVKSNTIFYMKTTPTKITNDTHWYNQNENKWYKYVTSESSWQEVTCVPIAVVQWNSSYNITSLDSIKPFSLVKTSDLKDFYSMKGLFPDKFDYVVERYRNGWDYYYVFKSGWVEQGGQNGSSGDTYINFYVPFADDNYNITLARLSGVSTTGSTPIWIRYAVSTGMRIYSANSTGKYWRACGYRASSWEVS